jgi:hypothetical protein
MWGSLTPPPPGENFDLDFHFNFCVWPDFPSRADGF